MASLKMPFGKYRGKRLISVPSEYLNWLLDNNDSLDADLRKAVEQELDRRGEGREKAAEPQEEAEPVESPSTQPEVEVRHLSPLGQRVAGDLRMLYRSLALKYHPDRGGSQLAMQALNELHEQVQDLLNRTFGA